MVPSVTTSPLPFTAKYAFSPTLPTVRPVSDHTLPCALTLPSLSTFTRPSILVTPFSRLMPKVSSLILLVVSCSFSTSTPLYKPPVTLPFTALTWNTSLPSLPTLTPLSFADKVPSIVVV